MNILSLATGMMVARSAGIADAGEQVRLGLLGAVAGGVVGVALTSQMARNEVESSAAPIVTGPIIQGPLVLPPSPTSGTAPGTSPPTTPGPVLVEVPRVVHLTLAEATRLLGQPELGLKVATQYARPARGEAKDLVLEQHNPDGSHSSIVVFGSTVVLTLSSGPLEPTADEPSTGELSKQVDHLEHQMKDEFYQSIGQLHAVVKRIGEVEAMQQQVQKTQKQMLELLQTLTSPASGAPGPGQKTDPKPAAPSKP